MTTVRLLTLSLVLLAVPAAAFAGTAASCPQLFPGGQPPTLVNPRLAQRTTMLCNDAYAAVASGVTRDALWSAEHLTAADLAAARDTPRQNEFHPDSRLPPADQAHLDDHRQSGYDRGHMTPSGDMPTGEAQQQSFSLANMVPQTAALNRGIWAVIETAVRRLAVRRGELYLVMGPAFAGEQIASIGPSGVLVPSATWKAVYDPRVRATGVRDRSVRVRQHDGSVLRGGVGGHPRAPGRHRPVPGASRQPERDGDDAAGPRARRPFLQESQAAALGTRGLPSSSARQDWPGGVRGTSNLRPAGPAPSCQL